MTSSVPSRGGSANVARLFGVHDDLATAWRRIHSPLDVTAFRVRQLGWSARRVRRSAGSSSSAPGSAAGAGLLLVIGGPLLGFLVLEQRVARASARWQRRLSSSSCRSSAEQIGMLLSAGYSLGDALNRVAPAAGALAPTSSGCAAASARASSETQALREWADRRRRGRRRAARPRARAEPRGRRPRSAHLRGGARHPARRAARARRAVERREPAGLDPGHGGDARARRDLHGRPVHRGHAPLRRA